MGKLVFTKPFTQQESIPEAGIERAVEIMRSGRLHRYNLTGDEASEASCLEREYATWQGVDYTTADLPTWVPLEPFVGKHFKVLKCKTKPTVGQ